MKHTRLWVVATIIACIILAGFVLLVPHNRVIAPTTESNAVPASVPSVALRDTFKKGTHTITGSIEAPNACTTVSAEATLVGTASSTQNILIAISMPEDTGICLQEKTMISFAATLSAPAHLPIAVTVNDSVATTTSL